MAAIKLIAAAVIAYLLGTIPSGIITSRGFGKLDIRKTGSGNSGTTNVLRTLGWVPGLLTLTADCLKGVAAALIGRWLGGEPGMLLAGFCAVLGHDFPVFSHFKGGKGIATSLGITIIICWPVAPFLVLIVVVLVAITHTMSIGSLVASIAYPFLTWAFLPEDGNRVMRMVFAVALALLSFFCHRSNLARLWKGAENRLDFDRIRHLSWRKKK